jgi:hypothetical protein
MAAKASSFSRRQVEAGNHDLMCTRNEDIAEMLSGATTPSPEPDSCHDSRGSA